MTIVASAPAYSDQRSRPRRTQTEHKGAAGAVVVGGIAAALGYLLWREEHGETTPLPGGGGGSCGSCGAGKTPPPLPDGLYETCGNPADPASCTIWAVKGGQRWGITTSAQFARCYGTNPSVHPSGSFGFGNADGTSYVGTVGYIAAGCPCIDVPH